MGVVENSTPDEARVILIDYRRTMLGVIEGDHLAGYSTSSQTSIGMMKEVAGFLAKRIPRLGYHPAAAARAQLVDRAGDLRRGRRLRHGGH